MRDRVLKFVAECQVFAGSQASIYQRTEIEDALRAFAATIPPPVNHLENLCISAILQDVAVGLARHVHAVFHRQRGSNSAACGFDGRPVLAAQWLVMRNLLPARAFVASITSYLDVFEAAHPIPTAERAAELIERRYGEHLPVSDVAREVGCHPVSLRALFKARYGMTIRQYQTTCRLRHAAELLRNSVQTIDEIIEQVGFGSRDYFYRAYVHAFGVTPGAYRKGACAPGRPSGLVRGLSYASCQNANSVALAIRGANGSTCG